MTSKQIVKLTALRADADDHGDTATVALVDQALAGDAAASASLGIAARAVRAVSTGRAARTVRPSTRVVSRTSDHPWIHDVE